MISKGPAPSTEGEAKLADDDLGWSLGGLARLCKPNIAADRMASRLRELRDVADRYLLPNLAGKTKDPRLAQGQAVAEIGALLTLSATISPMPDLAFRSERVLTEPEISDGGLEEQALPLLSWSPALNTGTPWLDRQHRELMETLASIERLPPGHSFDEAMALLEHLRRHATNHFQDEERYLDAADPHVVEHLAQHRHLLAELDGLIANFEDGHGEVVRLARNILGRWLWDHIAGQDLRDFPGA